MTPTNFFSGYEEALDEKRETSSRFFIFKVYTKFFKELMNGVDPRGVLYDPQITDHMEELRYRVSNPKFDSITVTADKFTMQDLFPKFKESALQAKYDVLESAGPLKALVFRVLKSGLWVVHNYGDDLDNIGYTTRIYWKIRGREYKLQPIKFFIKEYVND